MESINQCQVEVLKTCRGLEEFVIATTFAPLDFDAILSDYIANNEIRVKR